ncbi:TRAP transporter small permease [Crenobacter caeni]|uniref:TRAP transporter small permease protein n=1 Tax=Crenobacter caeni TaxID=2705474 RepID=A0A6B2KQV9_9NEIS|nr:TRAP transporter small permease [Crenobacter caeni]NDV12538.1 TRAP transporter small permease [Crenobacter caeni]
MSDPCSQASTARHLIPVSLDEALAALSLLLICVISLANVLVRYFTDQSFAFTEEVSVFLLVTLTFFGAAAAFARGRHIRIGCVADHLPGTARRSLAALGLLTSLALFALMAWQGALLALDDFEFETTSPGIGVPQWWYTAWLPALSVWICLRIAGRLYDVWRADQ